MYFTNPSERDFSKFIGTYVFEEMEKKQEIQEIGRFSSGLAAMYVGRGTAHRGATHRAAVWPCGHHAQSQTARDDRGASACVPRSHRGSGACRPLV